MRKFSLKERRVNLSRLNWIMICVFLISLVPLYYIAKYNHPSVDDYYYGVETSKVWNQTHSFWQAVKASYENTIAVYHDWQGNFSGIFLMGLQPAIFGEQMYMVAPIILLTSYLLGTIIFIMTLFRRVFHSDWVHSSCIAVVITCVSMQFVGTPADSFYWYNGSIYYTFFYALSLLVGALMILYCTTKKITIKILSCLFAALFSFLIGGSNFTSAFLLVLILLCTFLWFAVHRDTRWKGSLLVFLFVCAGFLISALAPGNAIRQASVGGATNPIVAILLSIVYAAYSLAGSMIVPVILMWIFLLIPITRILKNSTWSFRDPGLVLLFSFALYAASGTPVFYAQGLRIPYRLMNIMYFSSYIFILFDIIYVTGWVMKKYGEKVENLLSKISNYSSYLAYGLLIMMVIMTFGRIEITQDDGENVNVSHMATSLSATYSLITKEAKVYNEECYRRLELYENDQIETVVVDPFTSVPNVMFHSDITTNPKHWKNKHVAMYYHKKSVQLSK